ncbi:unnamed protein product, partial [Ectocarpus sp. 4 AP-2014]
NVAEDLVAFVPLSQAPQSGGYDEERNRRGSDRVDASLASRVGVCGRSGTRRDHSPNWTHPRHHPREAQGLLPCWRRGYAQKSKGVLHQVVRVGRILLGPLEIVALGLVRDKTTG